MLFKKRKQIRGKKPDDVSELINYLDTMDKINSCSDLNIIDMLENVIQARKKDLVDAKKEKE